MYFYSEKFQISLTSPFSYCRSSLFLPTNNINDSENKLCSDALDASFREKNIAIDDQNTNVSGELSKQSANNSIERNTSFVSSRQNTISSDVKDLTSLNTNEEYSRCSEKPLKGVER